MTSSPHILVVDDHKSIREPLAEYLQKHGFRVSTAASGSEMNRLLKCSAIDLMVLDILMPGESGLEICRRVRATRDIPIILLTAMIDDTDIIVGLEMGADDYVTKPFNPSLLIQESFWRVSRTYYAGQTAFLGIFLHLNLVLLPLENGCLMRINIH